MSVRLSEGSVMRICMGEKVPGPILQVTDIKQIQASGAAAKPAEERYRLVLSDGQHWQQALLATQCNDLIKAGKLKQNCVCRILESCLSDVQGRKVVIVAKLEVLQSQETRIGNPVPIDPKMLVPKPQIPAAGPGVPPPVRQAPASPVVVARPAGVAVASPSRPAPNYAAQQRAPQPTQQQQQQQQRNDQVAAPAEDLSGLPMHPIKSLNPYQNRWCIRARVTSKSAMKEFNGQKGPGKLFSVDLIDASGDEIRATAFSEIADKFFPVLNVGQVYFISRGTLKVANKKYTTIPHEYEITMNSNTAIQPAGDESGIPHARYNFEQIDRIATREKDELVDVLGVVTQSSELQSIQQKSTGQMLTKRTLTLLDMSSHSIEVTLWAEKAALEIPQGCVVAIRAAKVSTFNNKSLTTNASSQVDIAPDIDEAHKLRGWYDAQGGNVTVYPITQNTGGPSGAGGAPKEDHFKTLGSVRDDLASMTGDSEFFSAIGVVTLIKHDNKVSYQACPTPKCGSKVTQNPDGQFFCAKCNKAMAECQERYLLSLTVSDYTGSTWLSAFNEQAATVLGNIDATTLARMHEQPGGDKEYERVFYDSSFKWYNLRIRARMELYREEQRPKCTIVGLKPLDFVEESKRLLALIESY